MKGILRHIINLGLVTVLVLVFDSIGWLQLTDNVPELIKNNFLNTVIVSGIVALVLIVIGEIISVIYRIVKKVVFFAGCIITLLYFFLSGYIKLFIASLILPGWFTYDTNLLIVIVISFLIGVIRIPHREEMDDQMKEFEKWKRDNKNKS